MNSRPRPDDTGTQDDWPRQQVRLRPDIHHALELKKEATGLSMNRLVNNACDQMIAMDSATGGAAKIARMRKRLPPRSNPGQAALAYLLGYFGRAAEARRTWPWAGRFAVNPGDTALLVQAGALAAAEIDRLAAGKGVTGHA